MPACKLLPPPAALSCLGVKLAKRTVIAPRQNVPDACDAVAGAADLRRRFKAGQRVHRALTVHQAASAALTAKNDAGLGGTLQPSPWATGSFRSPLRGQVIWVIGCSMVCPIGW